ncbi:hypothetical protein BJX68DRAFT_267283 [Aspergillus pseudodeflectus]|uniref:Polyketide synthase n=1 Tax=Aspergillus pseudodeflectus TaxID=176178 RepID=A0ABR4KAY2_9EURO
MAELPNRGERDVHPDQITGKESDAIPIAVIGMAFRLPHGIESADSFWEVLSEAKSTWSTFPASRLNSEGVYHPYEERVNSFPLKGAHFIDGDIAAFDAPFFAIGPAEAAEMDPQARMLLETTYHALENGAYALGQPTGSGEMTYQTTAGIPMANIAGSKTSVHTGSVSDEYKSFLVKDPQFGSQYSTSSMSPSIMANRISWFFDLHGESGSMDSACSSTLLAFHTACHGLRTGSSNLAIVAGSNLFLGPDLAMSLNNQNILSPDGRCHSFDERANGHGRGEGLAAIILKRADDAIRDDNSIRAVVRGTDTNHDGRTPGFVQPGRAAQTQLIRQTYKRAGLDMSLTRYVEAHGTGTPVGDPIEAGAIADAFADVISLNNPLYIGSVKSNIGHLESASAVAGIVKSVLMLEQGMIPAISGLENVNRVIADEHLCLKFPKELTLWPSDGPRRLSINSFGVGGTNAHIIMDDAENYLKSKGITEDDGSTLQISPDGPKLLVFSAQDEAGIQRLEAAFNRHHASLSPSNVKTNYLSNLVYTLSNRRSKFMWRSFAIAASTNDLTEGLHLPAPIKALQSPTLALCFTGQGAQWCTMGRELLVYEVYLKSLTASATWLTAFGCPWDLLDELACEEADTRVDDPEVGKGLCTALQLALVDLLESLGVQATTVVGHSSGEIAAAYCIGALDRRLALSVAYHRGRLASALAEETTHQGGMMAAGTSETDIQSYLEVTRARFRSLEMSVGCVNSPRSVTITGDGAQLEYLGQLLAENGIFARRLSVMVAYHSKQMQGIAVLYGEAMGELSRRDGGLASAMVSSVTGALVTSTQLMQPQYWVDNMLLPVHFADALTESAALQILQGRQTLHDSSHIQFDDVLELGPHALLQRPIRETLDPLSGRGRIPGYVSALHRGTDAAQILLNALGYLHCRGHRVNIPAANQVNAKETPSVARPLTKLPKYPFDHSRTYWRESRVSKGHRFRKAPRHDLLGVQVPDWNPREAKWRQRLKLSELPWLRDHVIAGVNILPGAMVIAMAVEAFKSLTTTKERRVSGYMLKNVKFSGAVTLSPEPDGIEVEFYLQSKGQITDRDEGWREFRLYSIGNDGPVECSRGLIRVIFENEVPGKVDQGLEQRLEMRNHVDELARIRSACAHTVEMNHLYAAAARHGVDFGPAHRAIRTCAYNDDKECFRELDPHTWKVKARKTQQTDFTIHPTCIDGFFQLPLAVTSDGGKNIAASVVSGVRTMWISDRVCEQDRILAWNKSTFPGPRVISSTVVGFDASGQTPLVVITGYESRFLDSDVVSQDTTRSLCWNLDTRPDIEMLANEELTQYLTNRYPLQPAPLQLDHQVKILLYLSIIRTLRQLTPEETSQMPPHHQQYVAWMQREKNKLDQGEVDEPIHSTLVNYANDDSLYHDLLNHVESLNKRGKFFAVIARNLLPILTGECDVLELMFSADLVKDYYRELYAATNGLSKALAFVDLYAHKFPRMKILEIGAGTGGMTKYVLNTLTQNGAGDAGAGNPRFSHYTYTDISPGFFSNAAALFESFPETATFRVLDIEKDPVAQGFTAETYDLIIADNVFHATQDLDVTLRHTRKLLRPGGKLAVFELTQPEVVRTNFAFGLLPGWWRFNDSYRDFSAGVTADTWNTVLLKAGFSGVELNMTDYEDPYCHEHSVLISTWVRASLPRQSEAGPRTAIIYDRGDRLQQTVAESIIRALGLLPCPEVMMTGLDEAARLANDGQWY